MYYLCTNLKQINFNKMESNFQNFSDSGRFMSRESYLSKYPKAKLKEDCTDVVVYRANGCDIQALKSGEFYYSESIRGYVLDEVEEKMYNNLKNANQL